jgi:hypothetical protein
MTAALRPVGVLTAGGRPAPDPEPTTRHHISTNANDAVTWLRDSRTRDVLARNVIGFLERQSLHEDTPDCLPFTGPFGSVGDPIHLECHQPAVDPLEKPLADADHHVRAVDGVVKRDHEWCADLGDRKVPVALLLNANCEKAAALPDRQHLGPPLVDPHSEMIDRPPPLG